VCHDGSHWPERGRLTRRAERRDVLLYRVVYGGCPNRVPAVNSWVQGQNLTYGIANELGIEIVTGAYSAGNPIPTSAAVPQVRRQPLGIARSSQDVDSEGPARCPPAAGHLGAAEENWNLLDPDVLGWLLERKYSPRLADRVHRDPAGH